MFSKTDDHSLYWKVVTTLCQSKSILRWSYHQYSSEFYDLNFCFLPILHSKHVEHNSYWKRAQILSNSLSLKFMNGFINAVSLKLHSLTFKFFKNYLVSLSTLDLVTSVTVTLIKKGYDGFFKITCFWRDDISGSLIRLREIISSTCACFQISWT